MNMISYKYDFMVVYKIEERQSCHVKFEKYPQVGMQMYSLKKVEEVFYFINAKLQEFHKSYPEVI